MKNRRSKISIEEVGQAFDLLDAKLTAGVLIAMPKR